MQTHTETVALLVAVVKSMSFGQHAKRAGAAVMGGLAGATAGSMLGGTAGGVHGGLKANKQYDKLTAGVPKRYHPSGGGQISSIARGTAQGAGKGSAVGGLIGGALGAAAAWKMATPKGAGKRSAGAKMAKPKKPKTM